VTNRKMEPSIYSGLAPGEVAPLMKAGIPCDRQGWALDQRGWENEVAAMRRRNGWKPLSRAILAAEARIRLIAWKERTDAAVAAGIIGRRGKNCTARVKQRKDHHGRAKVHR
jgi:hypothetical protein